METVVSMLQEDAVTPATAYPPPPKKKKIQVLLVPAAAFLGALGAVGWGHAAAGGSRWSRSVSGEAGEIMAGPQVPTLSHLQPGSPEGPAPITLQGRAGCSPLPPLPTASPKGPGVPLEQLLRVPPREGRAAWPEAQLEGSKRTVSWGAVSLCCPSQGRKGGVSKCE